MPSPKRQNPRIVHPRAARALTLQALHASKRARRELLLLVPAIVGVFVVNAHRTAWFTHDLQAPVRYLVALAVGLLGFRLARDLGRSLTPALFNRLEPANAGTAGFLIRLAFLILTVLVVASVAGINGKTLAVGGAVFAVVFGLAAQQTLGNVIAGLVLISAQPFRVGDRVRLQAGGLAGVLEGVVASHGLLYTTFAQGEDSIMVPNNVVLTAAVVPLREPAGVDLRARLRPDVKPSDVQQVIDAAVRTPVRAEPRISLEEIDSDEVVVRISATPESESDGARLADEVLAAISQLATEGYTAVRAAARTGGDAGNAAGGGRRDRAGDDQDEPARERDGRFADPDAVGGGRQDADRASSVGRVDERGDVR
jgi:small conductance mechanosensitive channel